MTIWTKENMKDKKLIAEEIKQNQIYEQKIKDELSNPNSSRSILKLFMEKKISIDKAIYFIELNGYTKGYEAGFEDAY